MENLRFQFRYNEIVEYYMNNEEDDNIIKACKKYGDKDPNLWLQVLTYFVTENNNPKKKNNNHNKHIIEILQCMYH